MLKRLSTRNRCNRYNALRARLEHSQVKYRKGRAAANGYPRAAGSQNDMVSKTVREQQNAQSQIDTIHDNSRHTKIHDKKTL